MDLDINPGDRTIEKDPRVLVRQHWIYERYCAQGVGKQCGPRLGTGDEHIDRCTGHQGTVLGPCGEELNGLHIESLSGVEGDRRSEVELATHAAPGVVCRGAQVVRGTGGQAGDLSNTGGALIANRSGNGRIKIGVG
ncbi:hypothetical protein D3C87_1167730 [compost metagenome]